MIAVSFVTASACAAEPVRPNVLWISCEDTSPDLGCYGDGYAITPHLDRFAAEAVRYTRCFTHAGVCAPSRSGIITGMYPPSIGTHHMRCKGVPPALAKCFPEYLRAAGYYCTNNVKTDYQFDPPASAWDEISNQADWRGRRPGQPFFSVINITTPHESQVRDPSPLTQKLVAALPAASRHDPAKAPVWPFYPDTPIIRWDIANCYDNVTAFDGQFAEILQRLKDDGLEDHTIVWFWGDHGRGLSRCKRWLYDSGVHVPLLVRVPERYRTLAEGPITQAVTPGTVNHELVAFVDFAPTMLSLCGVPLPAHFQGQAFLGPDQTKPRQYVYGHRDRMDETYDLIRMVRDQRFKYLRNFRQDLSYGQDIAYMNEMPMMKEMRRLNAEGKLEAGPAQYFRPTKPPEELFDTDADPHELQNLAGEARYRGELLRLRGECERWMREIGDVGLVPEPIFDELQRPGGQWATAAGATVTESGSGAERRVTLTSETPGASVVYRFIKTNESDKKLWHLYHEPQTVPVGRRLEAKALRLGFRDSPVAKWTVGEPPAAPAADSAPSHWREKLNRESVLDRALALRQRELDSDVVNRRLDYMAHLSDSSAVMRYWAIWGLTQSDAAMPNVANENWMKHCSENDPDPLVRIIAARALIRAGVLKPYVMQLAEVMRAHPQSSMRLAAATALRDVGDAARPARAAIEAGVNDGEYVGRISKEMLERWKAP